MDTTAASRQGENRGWITMTGQGLEGAGRVPLLYAREIDRAGGLPRVYTPFEQLRRDEKVPDVLHLEKGVNVDDSSPLDGAVGLLLPGGGDIDPMYYDQPRHPRTRGVSRERDRFETTLLREALRRDMPVLCICRGFQLLNIHLGGSLDQHLADTPERLNHDRDMPRVEPVHSVAVKEGSLLSDILGQEIVPVNSHHHQGLRHVADGIEEVGWSGDGVLEAVVAPNYRWVLGVQWHPEVMAPVDHRQ
ncbi:MAG: gamma-glutamyl-gamma-aminobutyrate hydrolase family protein, partial [Actinobacteria bacterium]|nr:gamma-glutamyl-gamma-aminobutyrate hydrolase family protein [Actinomycetota bacterium]